eukprot:TRINITY_DN18492_c0_g1_i1.p1 TRINITY_DN18492_c0_g1~~TRINITY_DN18492_c0_g1_i1.p1  ORF type:complete len:698 (+),score=166.73 TRINITY_DN18492_c0_g1_i1:79-2094(+)
MANMSILFAYQKKKKEIGRATEFSDLPPQMLVDIPPDAQLRRQYTKSQRMEYEAQNTCSVSECGTNTVRKVCATHGQLHLEGCWPKDVDIRDIEHRLRYRRKAEKEEGYLPAVRSMASSSEVYLRQNNSVDIYQSYFDELAPLKEDSTSAAEGLQLITMLGDAKAGRHNAGHTQIRTACALAWQPVEGPHGRRLAVAYRSSRVSPFAASSASQSSDCLSSYIWDPINSNTPDLTLEPPSQLLCLEFNPKDLHILGGGCANGALAFFDCRKGGAPVLSTPLFDKDATVRTGATDAVGAGPVLSLKWLQTSGRGQETVTINGSNIVRVWDTRNLRDPLDVIKLSNDRSHDAICLGYDAVAAPNKFVIGTSRGNLLTCNRRGRSTVDRVASVHRGHHGAVYSVEYHPHIPKLFLSAGDWTARIWHEDLEEPLAVTKYCESSIVDVAWHPKHPGVFLTARLDGRIEFHNVVHKLCEPLASYQVTNENLHCLKIHPEGERLAVGTASGRVCILRISKSLLNVSPYSIGGGSDFAAEKNAVEAILEREARRERNLYNAAEKPEAGSSQYATDPGKPAPTADELLDLTAHFITELESCSMQEKIRHKVARVKENFLTAGRSAEEALQRAHEALEANGRTPGAEAAAGGFDASEYVEDFDKALEAMNVESDSSQEDAFH